MKISVLLVNRIIIMAVASIILIAAIPYLSYYFLEKHIVDEAVIGFSKHGEIADSIFTEGFLEEPTKIKDFDYEKLINLGEQVGVDLSVSIQKSKEPHGSSWLLQAYGMILQKMVINLSKKIFTNYSINRIISSILSILGLFFIFILGNELLKKTHKAEDNDTSLLLLQSSQIIYRLLLSILILAGSGFILIYFIKNLVTFIKYPPILYSPPINATLSFYFEGIVIIIGIMILLLIFGLLIRKRDNRPKNYLAFFWTVPVLAIFFNLYIDNQQISVYNTMIDTQKLNFYRQRNIYHSADIIYSAQQWYLQNSGKYSMEDFVQINNLKTQNLEYGIYNISANDTLLTIMGTGNFVSKKGMIPKLQATYNTVTDSLDIDILQ
jgi:hypothetical protein